MKPVQELTLKMADNALILGHRNSEWTGLGPVLEEDISFSSMAQDKIGHALALYQMLEEDFGMAHPEKLAFKRTAAEFKNAVLTELPTQDYAFALIRHFLFDHQEYLRYRMLESSTYEPLANLSSKVRGELKYHLMHANTWVKQITKGNDAANKRMQEALNEAFPLALELFEASPFEKELIDEGVFSGEEKLYETWLSQFSPIIEEAGLMLPEADLTKVQNAGRNGKHTPHLEKLLEEMTEVFRYDPEAEW